MDTASVDGSQIFALIVGIDKYKSSQIVNLHGAVGDATRFKAYLHDTLNVPQSKLNPNVRLLENDEATRTEILCLFDSHLLNNPKIQKEKNPTLILYFAGHGGRVAGPKGWKTNDGNVETICPVDDFTPDANGKMIMGIPDFTLNAKLDQLAENKGNNIVVILDCCHSGGAARDPKSSPGVRLGVINYGEDVEFRLPDDERKCLEATQDFRRRHSSYVLLAACQDLESARELPEPGGGQHSGVFTDALLKHLKEQCDPTSRPLTYLDLMESIQADVLHQQQRPTCYGVNKDRWLFRVEARSQLHAEPVFILENFNFESTHWKRANEDYCFTIGGQDNSTSYRLVADQTSSVLKFEQPPTDSTMFGDVNIDKLEVTPRSPSNTSHTSVLKCDLRVNPAFVVRVGKQHGVGEDSRFTIPLDKNSPPAMAILKVARNRIEDQHSISILVFKDQSVLYKTIPTNVKVSYIADSASTVRVRLDGSGLEHVTETSYFRLVTSDNEADVVVSLHTNQLKVKRFDPLILQLGGTTRAQDFHEVCLDVKDVANIPSILDHIARFHYYLGWSTSSKERIKALRPPDDINLRLHKLVTQNGMREPQDSTDHFSASDRSVDTQTPYGIKISKDRGGCVYLSLFSFDPKKYEIELCVQSNDINDCLLSSSHRISTTNTSALPSGAKNGRNEFTVGYGPGGGDPFKFEPDEHCFFKLFASGTHCDLSFIRQVSGACNVSGERRGRRAPEEEVNFRGAWVVGVVGT